MLLSTYTPLMNKREITCWENRPFESVWPENLQQKKSGITKTKKKRVRTAFTTNQLQALEEFFSHQKYITAKLRGELAETLNVNSNSIKIWFQNRRMKAKRESYESSSDSSSETVSIESPSPTHSNSVLPTVQVVIDKPTTERFPYYTDNSYQLPTYHNTNEAQSIYTGMTPPDYPTYFNNENTACPTQYYPYNINFTNEEGYVYNQYGSEINNCLTSDPYPLNLLQ